MPLAETQATGLSAVGVGRCLSGLKHNLPLRTPVGSAAAALLEPPPCPAALPVFDFHTPLLRHLAGPPRRQSLGDQAPVPRTSESRGRAGRRPQGLSCWEGGEARGPRDGCFLLPISFLSPSFSASPPSLLYALLALSWPTPTQFSALAVRSKRVCPTGALLVKWALGCGGRAGTP